VWVTCGDAVYQAQLTREGDNLYPSWGSDGKKIVFSSNRAGRWDVWIMNVDGTNQAQLTRALGNNIKPQSSPDGKRIVFLSDRLGYGYWHVWCMNADGSDPYMMLKRVEHDQDLVVGGVADDADPSWSPDGKNILFQTRWVSEEIGVFEFTSKGYNETIFMMDSTAGVHSMDIVAISTYPEAKRGASNETQTVWSPDGGKIAFISDRSGNLDIWVLSFEGFKAPVAAY